MLQATSKQLEYAIRDAELRGFSLLSLVFSVNLPLILILCVSDPQLHAFGCTTYIRVYVIRYSSDFRDGKKFQLGALQQEAVFMLSYKDVLVHIT